VRVLLTRPRGRNEQLAERLREAGHEVVSEELIALEPLGEGPIDLAAYDWLILTSATGAKEMKRRGRGRPGRVAAIGWTTAHEYGGADLIAVESTQEGLLRMLPRPAGRVLFAGAEGARRLLIDELEADFEALYRTRELRPDVVPDHDLVVLASPSAARAYASLDQKAPVISIGPETTRAAKELGLRVAAEASTQDLEGLAAAVAETTR
jgi:uroporphyrinogen-III synthase